MNKKTLFVMGLIIVIIIGSSLFWFNKTNTLIKANHGAENNQLSDNKNITTGPQPGQKAPDFNLDGLNDKKVSLSDYYGQKIFLNFWATWCPPCKAEMPAIQKLKENRDDIIVLTINIAEDKAKVLNYLLENNLNFSVLLDKDEKVARSYIIRGIPTTLILDKNGIIKKRHSGALTYEQMLSLIDD